MKGWFVLILLCSLNYGSAQNLSGQWRGSFNSVGNVVAKEGDTEYVLELEIQGSEITGYSYSYFNYPGKKYYVICRLEGKYDAASKSVVVNEEERIKGNTPMGWGDCLQTHILTFMKQGSTEKLVGRWRGYLPRDCGAGSTELERKMLTKVVPPKAAPQTKQANPPVANAKPKTNTAPLKPKTNTLSPVKPKTTPPVAQKAAPKTNKPVIKTAPAKKDTVSSRKPVAGNQQHIARIPEKTIKDSAKASTPNVLIPAIPGFERRAKNILKTIDVPSFNEEIRVDFYDNGEIDGDTISVFFNNKLILSGKRLTDKPLSLNLKLDPDREDNELVMYADNLGSIPPNTALMVATIDGKRYEVYITSTEKSSGTIRFRKKE
ncbi:hypothetical protein DC498_11170 [Terrimonas sp.]|uniref:hypothetical protein n=1 Tax=Terrimonas sp. TaxID=1914338 RepID=UPI000D50DC99|nr:hypothetical protein [Terrimonas sp.]PVD52276.1 hypothetical protein DC498_11170 [Terrimonas sp.]